MKRFGMDSILREEKGPWQENTGSIKNCKSCI